MTGKDFKLSTDRVIARMLTEPTGTHFLDSGGENGRGWQRRQGMTVEDFRARPAASVEVYRGCETDGDGAVINQGDGIVTLDTFHYLSSRLEYCDPLTFGLHTFSRRSRPSDEPWFGTMEAYAAKRITGDAESTEKDIRRVLQDSYFGYYSFNSYNSENCLSSEIQGITFTDERYGHVVLLHTHNGADVRGGYSTPHAFTVTADDPHDLFDWCRYTVACSTLGTEMQVQEHRDGMLPMLGDVTGSVWSEVHCWNRINQYDWSEYGGACISDPWEKAGKPQWHVPDGGEYGQGHLLCPACSAPAEVYPWL